VRRLLVATRSGHKLAELRALLALADTELVTLDDVGIDDEAVEDAETFEANALLKARFYAGLANLPTLADDSGVEVDALDGAPGVRTRRYAGENASDEDNNRKLLAALDGLSTERRGARYVCVLAYVEPGRDDALVRRGEFVGRIATAPRGTNGFGYDPIFEPAADAATGRTVGEMTPDEKARMSHRAVAARAMSEALSTQ
jgi:XTP/dITP diphosphohydrolase